jgi:hypothetical protein
MSNLAMERSPQIGHYFLGRQLSSEEKSHPLSSVELDSLGTEVSFVNEDIVHAAPVTYEGVVWSTILGAVNKNIYKISLLSNGNKTNIERIF